MTLPTAGRILDFGTGLGVTSPSIYLDSDYKFLGYLTNTTEFADSTQTPLPLDTELYKTGFTHSTSSNPSRVTITKTGKYFIYVGVDAASNGATNGAVTADIYVNGGVVILPAFRQLPYSSGVTAGNYVGKCNGWVELALTVNDYIECSINPFGNSTNRNISAGSFVGISLMTGLS